MNDQQFEAMKREIEEEEYLQWQMKQPGYWSRRLLGIAVACALWIGFILVARS